MVEKSEDGHQVINQMLQTLKAKIGEYEIRCQIDSKPLDKESIIEIIENILNPTPKKDTPRFFADAVVKLIQDSEAGIRLKEDGTFISEATVRAYRNTLWHLENYEDWRKSAVLLPELNKEFGESLKEYFNMLELSHNTKVKLMRILITAYNLAVEKKWIEPSDFSKARMNEIQVDAISLSEEEVDAIFHLNLSGDPAMDKARDLLITGIWTLMRFSDYSSLEDYHIKDGIIKSNTAKTGVQVHLPIHWQLQKIIDKYHGKLPKVASLTIFNREVKEVAKKAGLTRKEEIRVFKGGKQTKEIMARYTLVSSHTARRTGATLLYLDDIPKKQIMMLTGHKKEDTFDRYIRIGSYANAKMLADRNIFKPKAEKARLAEDIEDGYYWIRYEGAETIAMVEGDTLFRFKSAPLLISDFFKDGGKILKEVAK